MAGHLPTHDFGGPLRAARLAAGLSQNDLADKSGVHKDSIARFERGERQPVWDTVVELANALGVSIDSFRGQLHAPPAKKGRGRPRKR